MFKYSQCTHIALKQHIKHKKGEKCDLNFLQRENFHRKGEIFVDKTQREIKRVTMNEERLCY